MSKSCFFSLIDVLLSMEGVTGGGKITDGALYRMRAFDGLSLNKHFIEGNLTLEG